MNFYIKTFGCQMNKADSESIAAILSLAGHAETVDAKAADLIIVNTCNVREHAVKRLRGHVSSLKPMSQAGQKPWIAVGGCVGEMEKTKLLKALPQIDILFGTSSFHKLPEAIEALETGEARESAIDLTEGKAVLPDNLPAVPSDPVREWLPISRGCDNFCSYCVVPYARGRERSVPADEILKRAAILAAQGVKEITLLGQNVNSYGNDRGENGAFSELLRSLDGIGGLRRLRFLTSHPKDMSGETIAAVAECATVCEHVHLPLQAGSDRILKLMNRGYSSGDYLSLVTQIRGAIPGVSITTDLIVGFPGETESEFNQTMDVVRAIGFDAAYTFIYSPRPGTKAAKLDDHVSPEIKEGRLRQLITLQSEISLAANRRLIGETLEVFIERPSARGDNRQAGRTRTNKMVNCLASDNLTDKFASVRIDGATAASLKGSVCGVIE